MIGRTATAAVLGMLVAASFAPRARAQGGGDRPEIVPLPLDSDYWAEGATRPFLASKLEAGLVYAKPHVALGYGKPYWIWAGMEAYAITTNSFAAGYVGVRGSLPIVNLSIGTRYTRSYYRSFLPVKAHYVADDVGSPIGERAKYFALEGELSGVAPIPTGYVLAAVTLYRITGAPQDRYVYEESLRGVMAPPVLWAARLAYAAGFGRDDVVKAGILSELVGLPGRDELIFRAGPVAIVRLTSHLDAIGVFSVVVASPDSLGILHGPFGQLGLRYLWATGETAPAFP